MNLSNLIPVFKPTVASLGYALFLAVNATGVWGGVFPFLPLDFQTPTILFWFFLAQSVTFFASYLASGLGVYYFPGPTRRLSALLAGMPYLAGWCCLIAAIYWDEGALPLVVAGGALLGLGSAGFYMLWQRLLASRDADLGNRELILGTALAAVFYFALYMVPRAITAFLIPLVFMPLFALAIVLESRGVNREQPMFQDIPRQHPHVYKQVVRDYWRSALCVGALGFCAGIMRSLALGEVSMGTFVNGLSMAGSLVMAVVILLLWRFKSLRVNVVSAYRTFFPFIITAFLLLPFLPQEYGRWLAAILYAFYSAAVMLMMVQCAQAARDRGINPVFIYGLFGATVYALHDLGFFGGIYVEQLDIAGIPSLMVVALAAVYLLGMMYFIGHGGLSRVLGFAERDVSIELVALQPAPANDPSTAEDVIRESAAQPSDDEARASYQDRISKQAELVRQWYRLSAREAEVMELIARGNTVARIAEMLVVSENTIRTHSKRIYTKLGIHKKQELNDLIASFHPRDLQD